MSIPDLHSTAHSSVSMRRFFHFLGICLTGLVVFAACTGGSDPYTYTGRHIELDFSSMETTIEDQEWVEIDGIRFTHYTDFLQAHRDDYCLPASRSVWKEMDSPVHPHTIAVTLGSQLKSVQLGMKERKNRIIVDPELFLFGQSRLQLKREDESEFTIRTSPGYRVPITVLK